MVLIRSVLVIGLLGSFGACSKGAGDIQSVCEDNFAHGEKDNGKWSPGTGDKAKFMEYCLKQKPEVVKCSSMEVEFGDKECDKITGMGAEDHSGFDVKFKLVSLRSAK